MKLTDKEAAVLASVDLRADAPIGLIRRASGLREHTVRYALRALIDRKVITPLPFVNLHRLGFTVYTLFFTIGGQNRGTHEALISSLISARQVLWAGEFAGEFQYGIGFAAKNIGDLTRFLSDISQNMGQSFRIEPCQPQPHRRSTLGVTSLPIGGRRTRYALPAIARSRAA